MPNTKPSRSANLNSFRQLLQNPRHDPALASQLLLARWQPRWCPASTDNCLLFLVDSVTMKRQLTGTPLFKEWAQDCQRPCDPGERPLSPRRHAFQDR
jgi:hypothetical protein